ncbi:FAD-binding oxidoreductase [Aestuariivirga litoralis]|nr:FAD-binding oxidoreductase [Aestuariivirga litoralis]MBG1233079.1 FAD-binding oxidoreductase [Aestuariivirga litoralis]
MDQNLRDRFIAIVGEKNAITDAADQVPYLKEWRDMWRGTTPVVLRPANTAEISAILKLAHETNTRIVPQSGNTGLVNGQIPQGDEVLLSLNRMTRVIEVDAANNTMTVEAGCILQNVQKAAEEVDRLFPLSLASEGSARIGGNLSSNAGGLNVLAYGNTRELCLGLEVVLADGRIWDGLRSLRKDNTGYDLKDLFIGAEGTLGVITAAVLKLFPRPRRYDTCFCAVSTPQAALELLHLVKGSNGHVVAFELLPAIGVGFAVQHMQAVNPLSTASPWYVLFEIADGSSESVEEVLDLSLTKGVLTDGALAQSEAQRQSFWHMRESLSESQKFEGGSIKHDVSVPVSRVPDFLEAAIAAVARFMPGARPCPFGHMGDGNIHFNVSQPVGMDKQAFLAQWQAMNEVVFAEVLKRNGSISAEHGIGRLKAQDMLKIKSPVELDMMRSLKQAFDPKNILNPGRVLPLESES